MEKILILRNEIEEISKLPLFIEDLGDELGLSPELIFNLNLVLEEAISNVVLYAYPKEEHEIITLTAKKIENQLIFILTDSGKEFDPTYHQRVSTAKDDTKESGIILEVFQKGYMYKDKVIRPSMVKVNE